MAIILAVPSLTLSGIAIGYYAGKHYLSKNYPAPQPPKYSVGQHVEVNGKQLTVFGYTGHNMQNASNLKLVDHQIWVTQDRSVAQTYAGDKGAVVTIAGLKRAQTNFSRYDNMHSADFPDREHSYTAIDIEPVSLNTDERIQGCFKRMTSEIFHKSQ